jgi:triosephosphate isomerase
MNLSWTSAVRLAQQISYEFEGGYYDVDIVLCPPFTTIKGVSNVLAFDHSDISVGAQNCAEIDPELEDTAADTGEVSAAMLDDLDCKFCIIGHSERRALALETDKQINRKAKVLLARKLNPIICCGESAEIHEAGKSKDFVLSQIKVALAGFEADDFKRISVAYEPIWAIGTGRTPIPEEANEVCSLIREYVRETYGADAAENLRVLYGGSMKPENAEHFLSESDIDGGLIGGAALDSKKFAAIIHTAEKI